MQMGILGGVSLDSHVSWFDFATEDFKQRFLASAWQAPVFTDINLLKGETASTADGKVLNIPYVHIFCVGIECDSISALNQDKTINKDCVQDGGRSTKTGDTARATLEVLAAHGFPLFMLECTKGLSARGPTGESNLHVIVDRANRLGYLMLPLAMRTDEYGVPQSRERSYILGTRVSAESVPQRTKQFVTPNWVSKFTAMVSQMRIPAAPIEWFLAPDDDDFVVAANQPLQKPSAKSQAKPKKKGRGSGQPKKKARGGVGASVPKEVTGPSYEVEHLRAYRELQLQWPPEFTPEFEQKAACLTRRQQECLFYMEERFGPLSEAKELICRDLHMSQEWGSFKSDCLPCIVSTSTLWMRGQVQDCHGVRVLKDIVGHRAQRSECLAGVASNSVFGHTGRHVSCRLEGFVSNRIQVWPVRYFGRCRTPLPRIGNSRGPSSSRCKGSTPTYSKRCGTSC